MTYRKKCTFTKLGKKKGMQRKTGKKAMNATERAKKLAEWKKGLWG